MPLPPLEAVAEKGHTIAAQGQAAQAAAAVPFPPMPVQAQAAAPPRAVGNLQPGDMLPPEAQKDSRYRHQPGPPFAGNQPELAEKYGVVRQGKHVTPGELGMRPKGLSPDTVKDLQGLQGFLDKSEKSESPETAADYAATPPLREGQPSDAMREAFDKLDSLDIGMFRDMIAHDLLNTDEQRRIIEERLTPLDLGEYIMNGYVRQFISIVPGKYEIEFKSLDLEEDYNVKRLVWRYSRETDGGLPAVLTNELYVLMTNVTALWAFNRDLEDSHLDPGTGKFNEDLFFRKFNRAWKRGFHLMASMSVHYHWFDARVKRLLLAERIKNG